ncbi:hypothetical protein H9P43_004637 [Blastocladiella emersonii ATCC 22665]|nr:hypothetical protein H9P43_004637 [Blastocladiella emersonii ATCC 22665]
MDDLDIYGDEYLYEPSAEIQIVPDGVAQTPLDAPAGTAPAPVVTGFGGVAAPVKRTAESGPRSATASGPAPPEVRAPARRAANADDDILAGYGEVQPEPMDVEPVPAPAAPRAAAAPRDPSQPQYDSHVQPNPHAQQQVFEIEPHATSALLIDDLSWWTSDRDIAQIAALVTQDPTCVRDVVFSEHKINGKSRGSAWVTLTSVENAAKTKFQFESIEIDGRIPTVRYTDPVNNPFRVLPKDAYGRPPFGGNGAPGGYQRPMGGPGLPPAPHRGGVGGGGPGGFQNRGYQQQPPHGGNYGGGRPPMHGGPGGYHQRPPQGGYY